MSSSSSGCSAQTWPFSYKSQKLNTRFQFFPTDLYDVSEGTNRLCDDVKDTEAPTTKGFA